MTMLKINLITMAKICQHFNERPVREGREHECVRYVNAKKPLTRGKMSGNFVSWQLDK